MNIARMIFPILAYLVSAVTGNNCPLTQNIASVRDIQDALTLSRYAYDDFKVGDTIPNTKYRVTFVYWDTYDKNDPGFKVFTATYGNTTFVTYRGTDTTEQLLIQAISHLAKMQGNSYKVAGTETKVNQYFLNAFKLLQWKIRPQLKDSKRKYILTGHSLGGALASLLALQMTQEYGGSVWNHPQSSLITFGQPRVGDQSFADLHDRLISPWRKFRFVLGRDPVPHIPLAPEFKHFSREIYLNYDTSYVWYYPWILYEKFWQICKGQEDSSCSNQFYITISYNDHYTTSYKDVLSPQPKVYKTTKNSIKSSFTQAVLNSC